MNIALLSDIHGNGAALQAVLEDCKQRQIDQYYFLGDYITDGPNVNSVLNCVRQLGSVVLRGNKEDYMLAFDAAKISPLQFKGHEYTYQRLKKDNLAYLATLPMMQKIIAEGVKVLVYHGLPEITRKVFHPIRDAETAERLLREYDCDVYVGGHIHIPYEHRIQGRLFVNPGSVGLPMRCNGFSYGILKIEKGFYSYEQRIIPYEWEHIKEQLLTNKQHYLDAVGIWSELFLTSLQSNTDVTFDFLKLAYETAGIEVTVGNTKGIDDESFAKAMQIWNRRITKGIK